MRRSAICTIVARNYLAQARTLFSSIKSNSIKNGEVLDLYALVLDQENSTEDTVTGFTTLTFKEIGPNIPNLDQMRFQYNIVEFATAVKPTLLKYLFTQDYEKVLYFDPDILVTASIDGLIGELDDASMILTPHILESPPEDLLRPTEKEILISGCFNLGFIGLSKESESLLFLDWWERQLRELCLWRPDQGLFVDQRWLDLAPGMISRLKILRHRGYNAAFWNLHERALSMLEGIFFVGRDPLIFFHFSGFDPIAPSELSRHQNRHSVEGSLQTLVTRYLHTLEENRYSEMVKTPYSFDFWDNGVRIPSIARRLFLRFHRVKNFNRPFFPFGTESFFSWLVSSEEFDIPPLIEQMWSERGDLQAAFPLPLTRDRDLFWNWVSTRGAIEYQLDQKLVALLNFTFGFRKKVMNGKRLKGENHFDSKMPSYY